MFVAFARGMLVEWEGKFAFGVGLGFDPDFVLVSGPSMWCAVFVNASSVNAKKAN